MNDEFEEEAPQEDEAEHEEQEEGVLERPLECSECHRPIAVHYTEIALGKYTHIGMCNQCPNLAMRLKGAPPTSGILESEVKKLGGLACGECGTTLEAIRLGTPLGCSSCYDVFTDVLVAQLYEAEQLPRRMREKRRPLELHIGRVPGEKVEMSSSLKLLALNEALNETLKREDYEQAAFLRDQIKALTEEQREKQKETKPQESDEKEQ